ncbi:putative cytochrome oxidase assembly protein [Dinoroseobacter shibae DFL 12 = DSM 16493]|jgi:cytochrome c oxidase assembly protein subunit 15|uniref:Heme A synthase n=1 Tax=Dinoroseobacter shibae (strain DSM 16493 / NCIMB 14021 / DFL 12) TaxID=398580 RepID=CTAA_DINSH|nr:heme A synthase [Dinoroseobacter shibae]A8LK55.1 RecName: Full=Heme A synthase; Short=HAS; AltName: Full=Cytochrome aa3-controlling protein [Dinoroseobacter shibae DFL 12 = DSM 16493]ABV93254.1 putative cytochrome oxidase assembly protein [Dinoroseobacter shibae DFL 12 = DSM 16493]URF48174.1 COX15/CtaA family protein [Dinoroseobacter shibae]URF52484.1 COX15/CtaA family protein [Dinoroseobacter shibae]
MSKKRSIFEEVSEAQPKAQPVQPGVIDRAARTGARGAVRVWLMMLFGLVVIMIAVGGLTRLTDSGLSITEWAPIAGAIPPLSAEDWAREFDLYRAIPEYQLQNKGMTLAEFQFIYWWEWGHRQLGRVIGLVWALGFFGFLVTRKIPPGWTGRLFLLGVLGGLQGAIGWWMVASGLTGTMLDVASYRLATHLGLAFFILGLIAWYIMVLGRPERDLLQARRSGEAGLVTGANWLMGLAAVQILLGALVAGIDAGRTYTDWPLMAGGFLPLNMWELEPIWRNFFEDPGLVQFNHRMVGYLLLLVGLYVWWRSRRSAHVTTKRAFDWVAVILFGQMVLGIVTVLNAAPWTWAIAHQFGAVVTICLILRARFRARYPVATSLRGAVA